ncbi:MAG: O-antigen ligase family protein, partial [Gammaproteobacteria bacterium]|nr:O-antigen ligase family protein [Gammaproteobacteria bacterium]
LFILGTIGVIIINYAPDVYFGRMSSIANYEQEGSAMGRIIAWKTAIRMAKENPVLGVGSGHFPVKLGTEFRPPEFGDSNLPWLTAHSIYFLILGELGLPGIIFLLAMLIGNYSRLKRLHQKIRDSNEESASNYGRLFLMLNASLIAYAIGGAFLSAAYYPHLYVIAAMIVAASYIYEMETSNIDDTQKQKRSENYNHPEDK